MDLTLEELADIRRRELTSPEPLELPEGFYQEVAKLISRLREARRAEGLQRELAEEGLRRALFLVDEIHSARILKAMERVASGETPVPALERERTAFLEVRQSLERLRSELVAPALSGKTAVPVPAERTKTPVMFLVDLGERILGADQRYYGPFRKGEVVNLPNPNAEFLVKHDYARRIKVGT
jgi:DNA replication initiation complex subunit (GINS family)